MNVGSLFSGIGGLDAGLARAGFRHAFLCEQDPWRRKVLAARFPGVPIYDDVRDVAADGAADLRLADGRRERQVVGREGAVVDSRQAGTDAVTRGYQDARGLDPAVDLLCGGFPCQDLSVAGQRRGLMHEGGRSNLFFEFARIIDALRPGWVLVENVPGLLSSNGGRDFGILLGTLADLGYGVAWRVFDSRFFGVPQRRRRVFIVGAVVVGDPRAAAERAGEVLAVGSRCGRHPATRGEAWSDSADAPGAGFALRRDPGGTGQGHNTNYVIANTMKSQRGKGGGGIGPEETLIAETVTAFHQTQEPITGDDFSPAIGATSIGMGVGQGASVRRLTPTECLRLQGLPDDWFDGVEPCPDSRMYAGLGDAVTAPVGEWIGRRLMARAASVVAA